MKLLVNKMPTLRYNCMSIVVIQNVIILNSLCNTCIHLHVFDLRNREVVISIVRLTSINVQKQKSLKSNFQINNFFF